MNEIDRVNFLKILQTRFHKNMHRHPKLNWQDVEKQLIDQSSKLTALHEMECTGGEPDLIVINESPIVKAIGAELLTEEEYRDI